jgi:glycosyltransferase involved in cell wall biosynthesis
MGLDIIQGLWVGPALGAMEQLSIESFLRQGHEFHLYTYGDVKNIPTSTIIKDAREILPEDTIKRFKHLALFANLWRFKLLLDRGGWWVDLDTVCLRPFDFASDYVFSSEDDQNKGFHVNNGNIKAPRGSEIMKFIYGECVAITTPGWCDSGPQLVERAVKQFGLQSSVHPPKAFCPVPYWSAPAKFIESSPEWDWSGSFAIHLWHEMWTRHKCDANAAYPSDCLFERLKRQYSRKSTFSTIYQQHKWLSKESASGHGSDLSRTAIIRRELPSLVERWNVKSFLDAPCGDFNWMKTVYLPVDKYVGLDIVPDIIATNTELYGSDQREFVTGDIVRDELPKVDMILCRDCLNHLPLEDGVKAIQNFRASGTKFLAATTFFKTKENLDRAAWSFGGAKDTFKIGDWRPLNLELPPFNLGPPLEIITEEPVDSYTDKSLGIWSLEPKPMKPYRLLLASDDKPDDPKDIFLSYQMMNWGLWKEFSRLSHVTLLYQEGREPIQAMDPVDYTLIHSCFGMPIYRNMETLRKLTRKQVLNFIELPLAKSEGVDHNFTYLAPRDKTFTDQIPFPAIRSLLDESTRGVKKWPGSILIDHPWKVGACWNERLWEWLEPLKKSRIVGQLRRPEHEKEMLPSWIQSIPLSNYPDYLKSTAPYENFILTHLGSYEHSVIDMAARGIRVLVPVNKNGATFAPREVVSGLKLSTFSSKEELMALLAQPVKNNGWRADLCTDMPEVVARIDAYCQKNMETGSLAAETRKLNPPAPPAPPLLRNVTALIKTFLRDDYLFDCVKSLRENYPDVHIMVADDGHCSDEKGIKLEKMGVEKYIQLPWNRGLCQGRNALIDACQTPFFLLGDDDFYYDKEARLGDMLSLLADFDLVGGAIRQGGKVLHYEADFILRKDGGIRYEKPSENHEPQGAVRFQRCDLTFNFFIAKTDQARQIRWNDRIKIVYEHSDYFLACHKANLKVAYAPGCVVDHHRLGPEKENSTEYTEHRNNRTDKQKFFDRWRFSYVEDLQGNRMYPDFPLAPWEPTLIPPPVSVAKLFPVEPAPAVPFNAKPRADGAGHVILSKPRADGAGHVILSSESLPGQRKQYTVFRPKNQEGSATNPKPVIEPHRHGTPFTLAKSQTPGLDNVTALIKTFLRDEYLFTCVESLRGRYPDIKIIVADDGHTSAVRENKLKLSGVKYLPMPWDQGLTKGRNAMLDACETPYFFIGDDDFYFTEQSRLQDLLAMMEVADLAGGGMSYHNRTLYYEGTFEPQADGGLKIRDLKRDYQLHSKIRYAPCDLVLNFFIAKTDLARKVRWEEQIHCNRDHEDFFLAWKKAGYKTVYCPDSIVVHRKTDIIAPPEYKQSRHDPRDEQTFLKKWGYKYMEGPSGHRITLK